MKNIVRPNMLNQEESSLWNALAVIVLCVFLAFAFLNLRFLQDIFSVNVSGESMENTIQNGDVLYADRRAEPRRGDIVIINVEPYRDLFGFSSENIIKRVIGLEGDAVKCENSVVYRRCAGEESFTALEESYIDYPTSDFGEVTVGEGEIFFLGDHRTASTDSRSVGCLKLDDVVGVITDWSLEDKSETKFEIFFHWLKGLI